MVIPDTRRAH